MLHMRQARTTHAAIMCIISRLQWQDMMLHHLDSASHIQQSQTEWHRDALSDKHAWHMQQLQRLSHCHLWHSATPFRHPAAHMQQSQMLHCLQLCTCGTIS